MEAGLADALFWWSLGIGLFIAFWGRLAGEPRPVARGRGDAVVHEYH